MPQTKILTDIIASEIVSSNMKQSQKSFDDVVDSMNLHILASKICEYHKLDVPKEDIHVCILGALMTAQVTLFPQKFILDGLAENLSTTD